MGRFDFAKTKRGLVVSLCPRKYMLRNIHQEDVSLKPFPMWHWMLLSLMKDHYSGGFIQVVQMNSSLRISYKDIDITIRTLSLGRNIFYSLIMLPVIRRNELCRSSKITSNTCFMLLHITVSYYLQFLYQLL